MKILVTLLICVFGFTHPLQCMLAPSLSDKLVLLRTKLDTLKKSLSTLKQQLEVLKNALKKPSGIGGGSSGGQPPGGGSGGTSGAKGIIESLPEEVIKEILSWNITFDFTNSKALYDSIKAAGRELTGLLRTSSSLAKSDLASQPAQIVIISFLLNEQLKKENKTLDVERTMHQVKVSSQSYKYTVLDFAVDGDNVMICKILLSVDAQRHGGIITDYAINQVVKQTNIRENFDLIILFLKSTDWKRCEYLLGLLFRDKIFVPEITKYFLDSKDLNDIRMLFFMLGNYGEVNKSQCVQKIINIMCDPVNNLKRESLIDILTKGISDHKINNNFYKFAEKDDFKNLLKVLGSKPVAVKTLARLMQTAAGKKDLAGVDMILNAAGDKKNEVALAYLDFGFDHLANPDVLGEVFRAGGKEVEKKLYLDERIGTILADAISEHNLKIIQEILTALGDSAIKIVELQREYLRRTALHSAVVYKDLPIVKALLDAVAGNAQEVIKIQDADGKTALHYAVKYADDLAILKALLDAVAGNAQGVIEIEDSDGKTALEYAVEKNDLEIVQLLLNALGDQVSEVLEQDDNYYKKAFEQAFKKHKNIKIVEALLKAAGDKVDRLFIVQGNENQTTILRTTVYDENIPMVKIILDAAKQYNFGKQLVELQAESGKTALHIAAEKGFFKIVQMLLDVVKDNPVPLIQIQDNYGDTALHGAITGPYSGEIIKELLKACPDCVMIKNKDGMTALAKAIIYKNLEAVQAILPNFGTIDSSNVLKLQQQQLLISIVDNKNKTVFHYVTSLDNPKIVAWILKAAGGQAKNLVMQQDSGGNTALHVMAQDASIFADKMAVQAVLKAAGDRAGELVMMTNNAGQTVFDLLRDKNQDIKKLLESYLKK